MVMTGIAAPVVAGTTLRTPGGPVPADSWECHDKLGTDPIESMMVYDGIDGRRRGKREEREEKPVSKYQIQPRCEE